MNKKLLITSLFVFFSFLAKAQYDLTITYSAASGISSLVGANKVYFHSGANDMAGPLDTTTWLYKVGNWGADDGLGEMVSLGFDTWTITFDPIQYYNQAPNGPVTGSSIARIAMVFRNEDGTLTGRDDYDSTIYMDLTGPDPAIFNSDGTPFFGVTAGTTGIEDELINVYSVSNFPNPFYQNTTFQYKLNTEKKIKLYIFDVSGKVINILVDEIQSPGLHVYNWNGETDQGIPLSGGIYYYSLVSGTDQVNGKLIIVR